MFCSEQAASQKFFKPSTELLSRFDNKVARIIIYFDAVLTKTLLLAALPELE